MTRLTSERLTPDTTLPKWVTIEWDDDKGTHSRQGFLTKYKHTQLPHREEVSMGRPRITYTLPRDVFRYTINGKDISIGPYFSEIRIYMEDA